MVGTTLGIIADITDITVIGVVATMILGTAEVGTVVAGMTAVGTVAMVTDIIHTIIAVREDLEVPIMVILRAMGVI